MKKINFIDALRGYAVAMVLLTHSSQYVKPDGVLRAISIFSAKGVELFFMASALTLALSWFSRCKTESSPICNFYIRRFFRIAPLFYVGIIFYFMLNGASSHYWAPNGVDAWQVIFSFLFINGVHPESINAVVPGGWSIAVEMVFYLIFPLVIAHVATIKRSLLFLTISSILGVLFVFLLRKNVWLFPSAPDYLLHNFEYYNFFVQLPVFVFGLFVYQVYQSRNSSIVFVLINLAVLSLIFVGSRFFPQLNLLLKSPLAMQGGSTL